MIVLEMAPKLKINDIWMSKKQEIKSIKTNLESLDEENLMKRYEECFEKKSPPIVESTREIITKFILYHEYFNSRMDVD